MNEEELTGQDKVDYLIKQYKEYHIVKPRYGLGNIKGNIPRVKQFINKSVKSILDYGCGKGNLVTALSKQYETKGYDPAIPKYENMPEGRFDMVVCFDVMEHLCHYNVGPVIREIGSKARIQILFNIACFPAQAILPNGWNAHTLLLEPHVWYRKISTNLTLWNAVETRYNGHKFTVLLERDKSKNS